MTEPLYESGTRAQPRTASSAAGPRAAEPREAVVPTNGQRLHRRRRMNNPLDFPKEIVPPGVSYELKADNVYGRPLNDHQRELRENHWTPVPASRHPELAIGGASTIRRGSDMVLMERPKYLTEEARLEEMHIALGAVQGLEEHIYGAPPGTMTRDHPSVRKSSKIQRDYAPGPSAGGGEGGMESES